MVVGSVRKNDHRNEGEAGKPDGITKFYGINGIMMRLKATKLRRQLRSHMEFGNEGEVKML